jgi:23S rRNA pseudouridine2605 synthase
MDTDETFPVRISKYIAMHYKIARRDAEKAILSGAVLINGEKPKNAASMVNDGDVVVYNKSQNVETKKESVIICIAVYKPAGLVVTRSDEKNRDTIYSILPPFMYDFHYVGRLDLNSEGVLLFTNSAPFARKLENPKTGIERVYHVKAHGMLDEKKLSRIEKGVIIDGESYRPKSVKILPRTKEGASNSWLEIVLTSGKNREIRKLLEHFNLQVAKLVRYSFGNICIKDFNPKGVYRLTEKDLKKLTN